MPILEGTIVFDQNWDAINATCETCQGDDDLSECAHCLGSGKQYRYIINRGSSRSSKTVSIIDCFDLYARGNSNKRMTVWRDTKRICVDTVLKDAIKHFKQTGRWKINQGFNKTDKTIAYSETDSTIEFYGADDEETVHGLGQDVAWFNEPYKIAKDVFDQVDQRTSEFIFIDYNPKKGHWVEDIIKDKRAIVIDSTFLDNPFCPPEMRRKILSYKPVSMSICVQGEKLQKSEAMDYNLEKNIDKLDLIMLDDLILCRENESKNSADAFKWSVYGLGLKAERPNRIFKWNKISLEEYQAIEGRIMVVTDWGKVDPWAVVEIKYFDGGLYCRELNYKSENEIRANMTTSEMAQTAGDEEGIVTWLFNKLGIDKRIEIVADNNRPMKIIALRRGGWTATPAGKIKGSIIDGIDLLDDLEVYYTRESENIDYEQENYSRKVDRHGEVLEEPEDADNHTIDAIRYGALNLQRVGVIKKV
jgi:PBSX family phage terminase large subunit